MKTLNFKIIFILFSIFSYSTTYSFDHSHTHWNSALKSYVTPQGLVKYKTLKSDLLKNKDHVFAKYLFEIQNLKLSEFQKFNKEQQMSFLINSYNALTIKLIIDNYPVPSIKKIGSFFKKPWSIEFFNLLDGKIKSLDPIEHEWLRPKFKDYRIHAAVNCASISCPVLRGEAYTPEKLNNQLNEQMKLWLMDKTRNQIDFKKNNFMLSKIFDWYEKDFVTWGNGIYSVISTHLEEAKNLKINNPTIKYLNYDWNLNESK